MDNTRPAIFILIPLNTNSCLIHDPQTQKWLFFEKPIRTYEAYQQEEVVPYLNEMERCVSKENLYAVGFISFEACHSFDPSLPAKNTQGFPLLWFGVYSNAVQNSYCVDHGQQDKIDGIFDWKPSLSADQYKNDFKKIRQYIRQGDIYQTNYTFRFKGQIFEQSMGASLDSFLLSRWMREMYLYPYSAVIRTNEWDIYSASPELFFRKNKNILTSRPMKGTHPRGLWSEQDHLFSQRLQNSEKDRAENLMIVDMVRNDLGKVADWGTVKVDSLFQLEKYPYQWQMTSQISCQSQAGISDIFSAIFPAASITGAPKKRSMEIINTLEQYPRRIYTGSIGFISPHCQAQFNVAIRTMLIDRKNRTTEYGTGSGIVWDSKVDDEWRECFNKTKALIKKKPEFSLVGTILWEQDNGFFLLEKHLKRLINSAEYFSIHISIGEIVSKLRDFTHNLPHELTREQTQKLKIRLIISPKGKIQISYVLVRDLKPVDQVAFAKEPIDSHDLFLYHKTTHRGMYEKALLALKGFHDVILWNENDEITESTMANIAVKIDQQLFTPPVLCGLLPGVYREHLLEVRYLREKIITKDELEEGGYAIYFLNSVRKLWRVALSSP